MKTLLLLTVCAATAAAQQAAPAAPPAAVEDVAAEPAEFQPAPEPPKPEPQPAPKPEPAPEPEPKPSPKPQPEPAAAAAPPAAAGIDEEWAFVRSAAEDPDGAVAQAAVEDLKLFVRRHSESAQAPEALFLLAGLEQKYGRWQGGLGVYLRLIHEYPGHKTALRAKSSYLELVEKKASRKQRPPLSDLVRPSESADKADRLALLWARAADTAGETLEEPAIEAIRDFSARFSAHKDADKLQAALARLQAAGGKAAASMLSWRKLLAMSPGSPLRAQAQMAIGDLYADALRDPKKAIDSYQELVDKYPKAPEVLGALERSAQLFDEKLRQYDLAVEMDEKIVASFPKTAGSLKALKSMIKLQRDRLKKPEEAVKTSLRLSEMHGGQDGVDAILLAAEIARRDLKDSSRQVELLRRLSDDYAASREAPQALYDAAGVCEDDLKDDAKAIEVYKEIAGKFPSHKLAKKAGDRAAKLEAKR